MGLSEPRRKTKMIHGEGCGGTSCRPSSGCFSEVRCDHDGCTWKRVRSIVAGESSSLAMILAQRGGQSDAVNLAEWEEHSKVAHGSDPLFQLERGGARPAEMSPCPAGSGFLHLPLLQSAKMAAKQMLSHLDSTGKEGEGQATPSCSSERKRRRKEATEGASLGRALSSGSASLSETLIPGAKSGVLLGRASQLARNVTWEVDLKAALSNIGNLNSHFGALQEANKHLEASLADRDRDLLELHKRLRFVECERDELAANATRSDCEKPLQLFAPEASGGTPQKEEELRIENERLRGEVVRMAQIEAENRRLKDRIARLLAAEGSGEKNVAARTGGESSERVRHDNDTVMLEAGNNKEGLVGVAEGTRPLVFDRRLERPAVIEAAAMGEDETRKAARTENERLRADSERMKGEVERAAVEAAWLSAENARARVAKEAVEGEALRLAHIAKMLRMQTVRSITTGSAVGVNSPIGGGGKIGAAEVMWLNKRLEMQNARPQQNLMHMGCRAAVVQQRAGSPPHAQRETSERPCERKTESSVLRQPEVNTALAL